MRSRRTPLTLCSVVFLAFAAAAGSAAAAEPQGSVLEITVKSSRLSARVQQTRLSDVLEAVGRQAHVRVVLRGDLGAPVTETLVDVPLDEAIRRLSRWNSVVLIYGPSPGGVDGPVVTEVWVMGSSADRGAVAQATRGTSRNDSLADAGGPADPIGPTRNATSPLEHRNPEVRVQAIQALVREQGESVSVYALREFATRDPAPQVRLAAIRALASLNRVDAGDALGVALYDHDPAIRAAAKQAFGRWQYRARRPGDSN